VRSGRGQHKDEIHHNRMSATRKAASRTRPTPPTEVGTLRTPGRSLLFPGKLPRGKFVIEIDGIEVPITHNEIELLLRLAHAKVTTRAVLTPLPRPGDKVLLHQTIKRLRDALDEALGDGAGDDVVVHARGSRYVLVVDAIVVY